MEPFDERWLLVQWRPVPRLSAVVVAVLLHAIAVPLWFWSLQEMPPPVPLPEDRVVQLDATPTTLVYDAKLAGGGKGGFGSGKKAGGTRLRGTKVASPKLPIPAGEAELGPSLPLGEQARRLTKSMTQSYNFKGIYGFFPTHDYQVAARTAGDMPKISADELPPRFEQYVTVQITIDTDGHVAEARIVAGAVDAPIEQKLLAAVREFRYRPAQRDGVAIPSLLNVVFHVPS